MPHFENTPYFYVICSSLLPDVNLEGDVIVWLWAALINHFVAGPWHTCSRLYASARRKKSEKLVITFGKLSLCKKYRDELIFIQA